MRALAIAAAALVLGACATQTAPLRRISLDSDCASDITSMQSRPLRPVAPDDKEEKAGPFVEFADLGQCVATPTGKIAAAMFKLEDVRAPAMISLEIVAKQEATLAAAATLLDSRYQPLRRYGFEKFSRRGSSFTLDLFINPEDRDAAYLLLSPDAVWVGRQDSGIRAGTNTYGSYGPVYFAYNVGYEQAFDRQLTDAGSIRVEVHLRGAHR